MPIIFLGNDPVSEIQPILAFLRGRTPDRWVENAVGNIPLLLVDHANCEKKAASTALNLMYRYTDHFPLLHKLSRLAREELRHFEQVISLMQKRGIDYVQLTAARYASELHRHCRKSEPGRLIDQLIIGAIIEARSCERFDLVAPHLDDELCEFYRSLLKSESRHFKDYLKLASELSPDSIESRVAKFLDIEKELVVRPDREFRFHSGPI